MNWKDYIGCKVIAIKNLKEITMTILKIADKNMLVIYPSGNTDWVKPGRYEFVKVVEDRN